MWIHFLLAVFLVDALVVDDFSDSAISVLQSRVAPNTPDCPIKFVFPEFGRSVCKGNGYFIDFGSSGMKVYRAHRLRRRSSNILADARRGVAEETMDVVKITGVSAESAPCEITAALDKVATKVDINTSSNWALLATASMRLKPKTAPAVLAAVREWGEEHRRVFGRCGPQTENEDCGTLPGSLEASFEMRTMVACKAALDFLTSDTKHPTYGFASCGGGSLQVGLRGPTDQLKQCQKDLGNLSKELDRQRVDVLDVAGEPALLVSFLGSHALEKRPCEKGANDTTVCDYLVGGINEMRANFDNFLSSQGLSENPCLSPYTRPWQHDNCKLYHTPTTHCVIDKFGGTVSRLPPVGFGLLGVHRAAECQNLVREFISKDLMLHRWAASSACTGLAKAASRIGVMSTFTSLTSILPQPGQLLDGQPSEVGDTRNVSGKFGTVRELAGHHSRFASEEEVKKYDSLGRFVDLTLLVRFLEVAGVSDDALVRGIPVEWAELAMMDRGLVPGWVTSDPDGKLCSAAPNGGHI